MACGLRIGACATTSKYGRWRGKLALWLQGSRWQAPSVVNHDRGPSIRAELRARIWTKDGKAVVEGCMVPHFTYILEEGPPIQALDFV